MLGIIARMKEKQEHILNFILTSETVLDPGNLAVNDERVSRFVTNSSYTFCSSLLNKHTII